MTQVNMLNEDNFCVGSSLAFTYGSVFVFKNDFANNGIKM